MKLFGGSQYKYFGSQCWPACVLVSSPAYGKFQRFTSVGMICLHSFLKMVFLDNFFHGDMHSGNLLCRFAHQNKEVCWCLCPFCVHLVLEEYLLAVYDGINTLEYSSFEVVHKGVCCGNAAHISRLACKRATSVAYKPVTP